MRTQKWAAKIKVNSMLTGNHLVQMLRDPSLTSPGKDLFYPRKRTRMRRAKHHQLNEPEINRLDAKIQWTEGKQWFKKKRGADFGKASSKGSIAASLWSQNLEYWQFHWDPITAQHLLSHILGVFEVPDSTLPWFGENPTNKSPPGACGQQEMENPCPSGIGGILQPGVKILLLLFLGQAGKGLSLGWSTP